MRFNKIFIEEAHTKSYGIGEINISRLGAVVALVGKNGSGKTRILDILQNYLFGTFHPTKLLDQSIDKLPRKMKESLVHLKPYEEFFKNQSEIFELTTEIALKGPNIKSEERVDFLTNSNQKIKKEIGGDQLEKILSDAQKNWSENRSAYLRRIKFSDIQQLQTAILGNDSGKEINFEALADNVNESEIYDEFSVINKTAMKFLTKLPHQLTYDFISCGGDESKYTKRVSFIRFHSLQKLIRTFLKKELVWEKIEATPVMTENGVEAKWKGRWILEGREFNYMQLSDGEKTLFSYALLLFLLDQNPNLKIRSSIILIDEPELHLHPEAEISLIEGLRSIVEEKGQLIFATHSINILSHMNHDEIFMVRNGKISHPSRKTPGETLEELMGLEERAARLSDFLSSGSTWMYVNFMAECFSDPDVIESARPNDPQVIAFKRAIIQLQQKQQSLLLDFGAGKGRLLEQLMADSTLSQKVSCSALEPETKYHKKLKELGIKDVFAEHKKLPTHKFDFIVLCNVLHEIPIKEWESCLYSIFNALKVGGFLIIIEANFLTKGEKIGTEGFLVMGPNELKKLFNMYEEPSTIVDSEGKITCVILAKSQIFAPTNSQIVSSLRELEKRTLEMIIKGREGMGATTKSIRIMGREAAFLSQLHINARIAQKKLGYDF